MDHLRQSDKYTPCVMMFVRDQNFDAEDHNDKFLASLGGQTHVRCGCSNFPLIASYRSRQDRKRCTQCHRPEKYICSDLQCTVRLCHECHKSCPKDEVTIIEPSANLPDLDDELPTIDEDEMSTSSSSVESMFDEFDDNDSQDADHRCASYNDSQDVDHRCASDRSTSSSSSVESMFNEFDDDNLGDFGATNEENDDLFAFAPQDFTFDTEIEDHELDQPFLSTNAAESPDIVEDMPWKDTVSGQVIMNHVGHCLTRFGKNMSPRHFEKFFIQNQVATTPNRASPLTYPEASMFPRIFWSKSKRHSQSILGSIPLWAMGPSCTKFSFPNPAKTSRCRFKYTGLTQTCKFYHRHRHDVQGNAALSKGDSRQINEQGFRVDTKSPTGLSVDGDTDGSLKESVDSQFMVLGLSASQEFHKWDYFGTATPNQSETPGLKHITDFKRSEKWFERIRDSRTLNEDDMKYFCRAMEDASGPVLLRNWIQTRSIFLEQLMKRVHRFGGKIVDLFCRDEYQSKSGNLPHIHFVLIIDKSEMGPHADEILMDIIRTSPMSIVRPDELEAYLADGSLKSVDDLDHVAHLAAMLLAHRCNDRCKRRVGEGDGPENFKCRKLHNVRDTPDCGSHQFIDMPHPFKQEFNEMMEDIGMCTYDQFLKKYVYDDPFFNPTRHMPPCIYPIAILTVRLSSLIGSCSFAPWSTFSG